MRLFCCNTLENRKKCNSHQLPCEGPCKFLWCCHMLVFANLEMARDNWPCWGLVDGWEGHIYAELSMLNNLGFQGVIWVSQAFRSSGYCLSVSPWRGGQSGASCLVPSVPGAKAVICSKAGAGDLLIPLWNGSRHSSQCGALLLQQGKLFMLLKDGYLNLQKQFFPVSFNLSAAAVSVTEQCVCIVNWQSLSGLGEQKGGEGRRKG